MRTMRAYYKECFDSEKPRFLRVMKAVPAGKASYRPDPRSSSAAEIVWLLASELGDACEVVERGKVDFVQKPVPASVGESIAAFENNAEELERLLAKLDDSGWDRKAQFLMDGKVAWETSLGDMLFGFLFDAVHHRGQLSSYLRPMGAKVPSIYGPSADDPGA